MQPSHVQEAIPSFWRGRVAFFRKLFGYTGVSALALALDFTIYSLLLHASVGAVVAAAIGYMSGLVISYLLTRSMVFKSQKEGTAGVGEVMGFVATGVAGLVITSAVVAVSTHWFHLDPRIGKLLAVGISFFTVFLMRSRFVFGDSAK